MTKKRGTKRAQIRESARGPPEIFQVFTWASPPLTLTHVLPSLNPKVGSRLLPNFFLVGLR